MSDMEETEGHAGPAAPHRVIGTPPPSPSLLASTEQPSTGEASTAVAEHGGAVISNEEAFKEHIEGLPPDDPRVIVHGQRVERIVAACFILAFIAGCGFIAAYVGLGVHTVDKTLRSNLALGVSLSVTLGALGLGALLWVRHLMPNVEVVEERHDLRSDPKDRQAFESYFKEGTANSEFVKRPLVRRTLMLGTLPLLAAPIVLLRDLGPLPGTSLRHTVWSPGRRLLVDDTNLPITPAQFSAPGQSITIVPEGFADNLDALAKATVTLIKFRPGELNIPTTYAGQTLIGTMNWTVDNIVAYSRICTHVGCPVGLYEQTTHHLLCPCHQSTFDASTGATVIFGPAPRPLPQLPLTVDAQGFLVSKFDFTQPVGPSFWERG
jgi:ubiquinol-cytochrome c reductase iron-sulfur subunit